LAALLLLNRYEIDTNSSLQAGKQFATSSFRFWPSKLRSRVWLENVDAIEGFNTLAAAGFQTLPKIIELKVTEEHLALDRAFFEGAVGYPLQVLFRIDAQ
jgi:hypothetical protein